MVKLSPPLLVLILAAATAFAAAWVQARFATQRAMSDRTKSLENAASAARWVLQAFTTVRTASDEQRPQGRGVAAPEALGPLTVSTKTLADLKRTDFDDPILATAIFDLQGTMAAITRRLQDQLDAAAPATAPIVTDGWTSQDEAIVLNQAAAVERRVAELCGRRAAL